MTNPPPFPHDDVTVSLPEDCPHSGFAFSRAVIADRSHVRPRMAPVSADIIDGLRAKVRAIERHPPVFDAPDGSDARPSWTLGCPFVDAILTDTSGPDSTSVSMGLDLNGLHEVKPVLGGAGGAAALDASALGFALRLAVRRLAGLGYAGLRSAGVHKMSPQPEPLVGEPLIVWCWTAAMAAERGRLYGPGLAGLGLNPAVLLLVETARASDTLWAIEEALKSRAAVLVMGVLDAVDLTAARRLSLAAESFGSPCLLVTGARHPSTPAAASRWRVGLTRRRVGRAEGFRANVMLERCRLAPARRPDVPFELEWCDEAHRFRSPVVVANREPGSPSVRASVRRSAQSRS